MPPRATWKGHVKLSLVSFAVRVYNATGSASKISLNQLHKGCNQRLRQKLVCPEHGDVEKSEIVKGYEFEKGRYVVVDPEDLERIQLETTKTIENYVAPDGPVAEEAFRVIRDAMRKVNKIGIGRFVVGGKEQLVALDVEGRGLLMTTLRSAAEVRGSDAYFEDIPNGAIDGKQLELAEELIKGRTAELDTSTFVDRYQEAMLGVIKAKVEGKEPQIVEEVEMANPLSFMDALEASLGRAAAEKKKTRKKPPAGSVKKTARQVRKKA
jgi:DNA end-binding protein Ku